MFQHSKITNYCRCFIKPDILKLPCMFQYSKITDCSIFFSRENKSTALHVSVQQNNKLLHVFKYSETMAGSINFSIANKH